MFTEEKKGMKVDKKSLPSVYPKTPASAQKMHKVSKGKGRLVVNIH